MLALPKQRRAKNLQICLRGQFVLEVLEWCVWALIPWVCLSLLCLVQAEEDSKHSVSCLFFSRVETLFISKANFCDFQLLFFNCLILDVLEQKCMSLIISSFVCWLWFMLWKCSASISTDIPVGTLTSLTRQ